jgi:hypothetical protein
MEMKIAGWARNQLDPGLPGGTFGCISGHSIAAFF